MWLSRRFSASATTTTSPAGNRRSRTRPSRSTRSGPREAGEWLGPLHGDTASTFEGYGAPVADGDDVGLAAHESWARAAAARADHHRGFLAREGYADVADAVASFFRDHPSVLDGAGGPVLCHGDVHPEHHVRTGHGVTGIDFEHVLVAPAEYDYWRTAMPYMEAPDDVDDGVQRAFRAGYESVRSLPAGWADRRPYYELLNRVAFIESLYLQRTVVQPRRDEVAAWLESSVRDRLASLRGRLD